MEYVFLRKRYRTWGVITLVSLYLLVFVGGIVRSTGSGMGCPDWPKCFGQWVPPTDIEQLPFNYKEVYSEKRKLKNLKLAKLLSNFNLISTPESSLADERMYKEEDFNATKTWIEYLNRVLGVLVGFTILILAFLSLQFVKVDWVITLNTFLSLFLVGLEGWIGSLVVSTNLLPFAVTVHMFLAIILIGLLTYTVIRSQKNTFEIQPFSSKLLVAIAGLAILTSLQILLGSSVREGVDLIASNFDYKNRELWISNLGPVFYVHRSISILILIANIYFLYLVQSTIGVLSFAYRITLWFNILLWLEVSFGVAMAYLAIPPFLQPLHLVFSCLILGLQFTLFAMAYNANMFKKLDIARDEL